MFGSKEYYVQKQEEIRVKNKLEEIFEMITGHPIEKLDKSVYIKEYKKIYNKKHIKKPISQCKKQTAEEIKILRHNYYLKCKAKKEKGLERAKKHRNTEKGRASSQRGSTKRRSRLKNLINTLTAKEWMDILKQYKFRCAYCNKKFNSLNKPARDHIIPISKGGHNTKENIVPACKSCNSKKGAKINYSRTIISLKRITK